MYRLKKQFSIILFFLNFLNVAFKEVNAQNKLKSNSFDSLFLNKLSKELSNYESGSAISFLNINIDDKKVEVKGVFSSNSNSKKIIDSFFKSNKIFVSDNRKKAKGNYIVPIIQIMFDDNSKSQNELNWNYNDVTSLKNFGKEMALYKEASVRFLDPVVIVCQPPVSKISKTN